MTSNNHSGAHTMGAPSGAAGSGGAGGAVATAPREQRYCTFLIDSLLFGVGVREVQEVIRYQQMTPVPLAPPSIWGLINLRGQIVTAVDVRTRFGLPRLPDGRHPMNVVVRSEEGAVSLLVDEIGDVVDVTGLELEHAPETLHGVARELIQGIYKLDGRLLHVLDSAAAIAMAD